MLQFCITWMYVVSIVFFVLGGCKLALIVMNTKQLVTGGEIAGTATTAAPTFCTFLCSTRTPKGTTLKFHPLDESRGSGLWPMKGHIGTAAADRPNVRSPKGAQVLSP